MWSISTKNLTISPNTSWVGISYFDLVNYLYNISGFLRCNSESVI
jgi:hypothetical protein